MFQLDTYLSSRKRLLNCNIKITQIWIDRYQRQSFEDVLQNRYSQTFCNIYRKRTVLESFFNKIAVLGSDSFIRNRLQHRCFLKNISKFLRTAFLKNNSGGCCFIKWLSKALTFWVFLSEYAVINQNCEWRKLEENQVTCCHRALKMLALCKCG